MLFSAIAQAMPSFVYEASCAALFALLLHSLLNAKMYMQRGLARVIAAQFLLLGLMFTSSLFCINSSEAAGYLFDILQTLHAFLLLNICYISYRFYTAKKSSEKLLRDENFILILYYFIPLNAFVSLGALFLINLLRGFL